MDSETRSFALESALTEMGNACPDIKNSFMFSEGGEIVARDERTSDSAATRVINAFDSISEKADAIGGVKGIALESSRGIVRISCVNDLYLVTVTSREADMNYVNTVTRVLIPTVIKLLEKITPAPLKWEQGE